MHISANHRLLYAETPLVSPAKPLPSSFWPEAQHPLTADQEERIRAALGYTGHSLPAVRIEWLRRYYEYLTAHLLIPFAARCAADFAFPQPTDFSVTVVALFDPYKIASPDSSGLVCRVRNRHVESCTPLVDIEVDQRDANSQLLEDYWYWIWNWRFDPRI
ncbi:MAG: hypothetical protein HUU20_03775 [Pirellulales bacterium]|nr:hypothetical protein [Pirellulales bacterium]